MDGGKVGNYKNRKLQVNISKDRTMGQESVDNDKGGTMRINNHTPPKERLDIDEINSDINIDDL